MSDDNVATTAAGIIREALEDREDNALYIARAVLAAVAPLIRTKQAGEPNAAPAPATDEWIIEAAFGAYHVAWHAAHQKEPGKESHRGVEAVVARIAPLIRAQMGHVIDSLARSRARVIAQRMTTPHPDLVARLCRSSCPNDETCAAPECFKQDKECEARVFDAESTLRIVGPTIAAAERERCARLCDASAAKHRANQRRWQKETAPSVYTSEACGDCATTAELLATAIRDGTSAPITALEWHEGEPPRDGTKQYVALAYDKFGSPDETEARHPRWCVVQWGRDWPGGESYWQWSSPGRTTAVRIIKWAELPELDWVGARLVDDSAAAGGGQPT